MNKDLYSKIRRAADRCLMCGADLKESGKHPSSIELVDSEDEVMRKDYCQDCWGKIGDVPPYFSYWMAKRDKPPERTRISREERNRLLLALFETLSQSEAGAPPESLADILARRFFLAHLLMRFRVFRWKRTDHEAQAVVFENIANNEEWTIQQIDLNDELTLAIKQEIEEYLRRGDDLEVAL